MNLVFPEQSQFCVFIIGCGENIEVLIGVIIIIIIISPTLFSILKEL